MAGKRYLALESGLLKSRASTDSSSGVGNAGDVVALDGTGKINANMLPTGVGPDTKSLVASENLSAGDFVNVWDDAGTEKCRKADASNGRQADGFVVDTVTLGNPVNVYFEGINDQLSGLTKGARYWLSATTPGDASATPISGTVPGEINQLLGKSVSATELAFEGSQIVEIV